MKTYTYHTGTPSWHQAQAGHASAGTITATHTPEDHAAFVARYKARGEAITWTEQAPAPATPAPLTRVTTYKGQGITRLYPSGMFEMYSVLKGRFLKFDTMAAAKAAIRAEV